MKEEILAGIKAHLKANNISQRSIAAKMGIVEQRVSNMLAGRQSVALCYRLEQLADVCGCRIEVKVVPK